MIGTAGSLQGDSGGRKMPMRKPKTKAGKKAVVAETMGEFKRGELHSGSKSGPKVTNPRQAKAIAMSKSGMSKKKPKMRNMRGVPI